MKSFGVMTIPMKPPWHSFDMVLFVFQHFLQSEIWVVFLLLQTTVQKIKKTPNNTLTVVDDDTKAGETVVYSPRPFAGNSQRPV